MKGFKANAVCVVDASHGGYQCYNEREQKEFFLPFSQSKDLECTPPDEAEQFIKACKAHEIKEVTVCKFVENQFQCTQPDGTQFQLSTLQADNYVCLGSRDKLRLKERCKKG